MQAFEFHATTQNGFIRIPDEYVNRIPSSVKVIVLAGEKPKTGKRAFFPDFKIDTTGYIFNREEAMSDKVFLDTNLFVYMQSTSDNAKKELS
jgi:hypothetical protein